MIQNKNLAYDFNRQQDREIFIEPKPKFKVLKSKNFKKKLKTKNKISLCFTTICIFTMLILLSYRYNLISEKNLNLQRKNIELDNIASIFTTTEISIKKGNNLKYIENYAKQQLGMQKPEKNQIIYINANYQTEVTNMQKENIFQKILDMLKVN